MGCSSRKRHSFEINEVDLMDFSMKDGEEEDESIKDEKDESKEDEEDDGKEGEEDNASFEDGKEDNEEDENEDICIFGG